MKLPWDEKYLKISFHAVLSFICAYIGFILINCAAYGLANAAEVLNGICRAVGKALGVLSPLIIGMVAAYMLEPMVAFYQRVYDRARAFVIKQPSVRMKEQSRVGGVILTIATVALIIGIFVFYTAMELTPKDGRSLSESLSLSLARTANDMTDFYTRLKIRLEELGVLEYVSGYLDGVLASVLAVLRRVGDSAVKAAGGGIISFVLGMVIAVYLMKDMNAIRTNFGETADIVLTRRFSRRLRNILSDTNAVFTGYIRGQLTDAVIMAFLIGGWLTLLKVDFAIIIGIFSGVSNLIPYFGALIGFVLAVGVALIGGEPSTAVYAGVGILILQQIDAVFIVPKIVGENVELSPVQVLLSLTVAGNLFGFLGMLLAVPVTAIIKLYLTRMLARKKEEMLNA